MLIIYVVGLGGIKVEKEISQAVIRRMPRYYRYLGELLDEGVERISSNELSSRMNVTASQIRQDLNNFGGFGQQGYGYNVKFLHDEIGKILGLNQRHNIIVVGDNDRDMALAVKEMMRTQGGYTLVRDGEIYGTLPLPVMGLMSDAGYESVNEALAKMIPKAYEMGVKDGFDPFITLSFMALPVIPEIRITPRGIYLVKEDRMLRTPFC